MPLANKSEGITWFIKMALVAVLNHVAVGIVSLSEVEEANLETNGEVSVIRKSHLLPVTPKDLNIPVLSGGGATVVVDDGKVLVGNLAKLNYTEKWLQDQLCKKGVTRAKKYAQLAQQITEPNSREKFIRLCSLGKCPNHKGTGK